MLSGDALDEHLDDIEEEEMMMEGLKIPKGLSGAKEDDEDYGEEFEGIGDIFGKPPDDKDGEYGEEADPLVSDAEASQKDYEAEEEVFGLARENQEMKVDYANEQMVDKIEKIEDQMMDEKAWQLKGEIMCKDREQNGLLEEHLDFDTATKLPPQITQETTN